MKFRFSHENISSAKYLHLEYSMDGGDDKWNVAKEGLTAEFPSLTPGNYTLKYRTSDGNGRASEINSFSFAIDRPWYFNNFSLIIYFVALVLIFISVRRYYIRKVVEEQTRLREHKEEKIIREKKQLELLNLESEKELLVLRQDKLNLEIEKKNSELAVSTMNNIRKNSLLNELKKELNLSLKEDNHESSKKKVKNIVKKINREMSSDEDWLTFELHFNNTHSNFFKRLRDKYPALTSNDMKICAYLKLNLSSKEIASLMNISTRSVEMSRYRLRKKMNLETEDSLTSVLGSF